MKLELAVNRNSIAALIRRCVTDLCAARDDQVTGGMKAYTRQGIWMTMPGMIRAMAGDNLRFGVRRHNEFNSEHFVMIGGRQYTIVVPGAEAEEDILVGHWGGIERMYVAIPAMLETGSPEAEAYASLRIDGLTPAAALIGALGACA